VVRSLSKVRHGQDGSTFEPEAADKKAPAKWQSGAWLLDIEYGRG